MSKKWLDCLLYLCLIMAMSTVPVMADTSKESTELVISPESWERMGSIILRLEEEKEKISFGLVRVADFVDGEYILKEEFSDTGVDLNAIKTADAAQRAAIQLYKQVTSAKWQVETDIHGMAAADDLPVGVYLIYALHGEEYTDMMPVLVSIPTFDEVGKTMNYDVNVCLKHSPSSSITEDGRPLESVRTGVDYGERKYILMCVLAAFIIGVRIMKGKRT